MTSLRKQTLLRVGAVFAILVLLNIVSVRIFGRIDMTRSGQFTLAEASKQLMRALDDCVSVTAYFTEDLPAPYSNHRRELLDQLNEFRAYSNGNLQFTFVNPEGEKGEREAQEQGIAQAQVQVVKEDRFEAKRAYMGLVFRYEDRKEVIPVIESIASLEYDIASTIKRLTSRTRKKIGFLTGQGEPELSEFGAAQREIGRQHDLVPVDLAAADAPADIAALLIVAPKSRFSDIVQYRIDQYIMRGGRVAFLLNRVEADLQQRFGQPVDPGLDALLGQYGLRLNADMVRDLQCANVSIVQQQFGFSMQSQVPYPHLPLISDVSKANVMVKELKAVMLFFASSIDTTRIAERGLTAEMLLRTSKQSGRRTQDEYYILDPLQRWTQEDFTEQGIPLAAVVSGVFRSAFAGKPAPADSNNPLQAPTLQESPETRIVLVGDGDFARDQYLGNRDNLTLLANIVDYLVDDAGLITIRSKETAPPMLEPVSDGMKKFLKYGNLLLPPAIALVFGLIRWRMRKARKRAMT